MRRRSLLRSAVDPVMRLDRLEPRQLLATPSGPRPETLSWLDRTERAELLSRLDNMPSGQLSSLSSKLPNSGSAFGAFDSYLQNYMQTRTSASWYFDDSQTAGYGSFIAAELDTSSITNYANTIVNDRRFPERANSVSYDVTVAGDINWAAPGGSSDPNFVHTLNRFEYWFNLFDGYRVSGNAAYADEIMFQLADWSNERRTLELPPGWTDASGWQLDTSIRGEVFTWAYFTLLGASTNHFSPVDHTLLLYKIMQHGDWLQAQSQTIADGIGIENNRALTLAKSLHMIGVMFPEFDSAALWEQTGRELLFDSARGQTFNDGSHLEQSPDYAAQVFTDLLDARKLDQLNGNAASWGSMATLLDNSFEAFRQFLSPDGKLPAIGDTYRRSRVSQFLKAGMILERIEVKQSTIVGYHSTSATSFTVADATQFAVGDVINAANKSELLRVTGVNVGTNTLSVQRAIAGTGARGLDDGVVLYNLGDQPIAKPRIRDIWMFGPTAMTPFLNVPAAPAGALGERGKAYVMPDSGNFILRSDDTETATQITFDAAGPKGGFHGHHDPLNFELWSGGRPLIMDPGVYKYDDSADRNYVISTRAHNTINVDQLNTGNIEDPDGTGPRRSSSTGYSYTFGANSAQINAWHQGYAHVAGQPLVARSLWYNYGGVMILVDWVDGTQVRQYQQSFNLPGDASANPTGVTASDFKTRYASGHNVYVKPLHGGTMSRNPLTFVTADAVGDYKEDAYRYTVTKSDDFAVFVTLIQTYEGLTVPNVQGSVSGGAQPGQAVTVTLSGALGLQVLNFTPPAHQRLNGAATSDGTFNDIEYDSAGNLHKVWLDRSDQFLKYSVRDAGSGLWSVVQTIDDAAPRVGQWPDLKLDKNERPGVAYSDGTHADLKFAHLPIDKNSWQVQTVDSASAVGLYPSLMFTRSSNSAIISYYHRVKKDLRIASLQTDVDWTIETFASEGDQGRFSRIMLDPNRTDLNGRYVLTWEDTTSARMKYAFNDGGWKIETIPDTAMTAAGGYLSLAFEDSGSGTTNQAGVRNFRMLPRVSYYESSPDTSLKFASRNKQGVWSVTRVDGAGTSRRLGQYSQLFYNASNRPEIFYFDMRNNLTKRVVGNGSGGWVFSTLGPGGRELHVTRLGNRIAYARLSDDALELTTTIL